MNDLIQLLTDPENQPHQFVGRPNDLIGELAEQGHLCTIPDGLLKFEGLDEALKVASIGRKTSGHGETDPCINFVWGHERQAELILKAAKAYNDLIQAAKGGA